MIIQLELVLEDLDLLMNKKSIILNKRFYHSTLAALCSTIVLLAIFIVALLINPKVETKTIEVPKEIIVEVEKEIEVVVEKEVVVEVEKEPTYAYNITSVEREMLARLVYREANTSSLECQKAVISVVINRWKNGKYGKTLEDVIYAKNQFTPSPLLYKTTPNEKNYQAVDEIIKNGTTLPSYVLYFRADYHFKWDGYKGYTQIDDTYFGYVKKIKLNIAVVVKYHRFYFYIYTTE